MTCPNCKCETFQTVCPNCGGNTNLLTMTAFTSTDYKYMPVCPELMIKAPDHFYISVHGVPGIRLRIDSPTMDRDVLRIKVSQFFETLRKHL